MSGRRRSNGEGGISPRKSGGFVGSIRLPDGTRPYVYGQTRKAVAAKLTAIKAEHERGQRPSDKRLTVAAYLDDWLGSTAKRTVRPSTWASYETLVRVHIVPHIGRLLLVNLNPSDVDRMIARLLDAGVSPRRAQMVRAVLRSALTRAVRSRRIIANAAADATPIKATPHRVEALDGEQVAAIVRAFQGSSLYPLITLALATGARQGELLALRWSDIDLAAGIVRFEHTLQHTGGTVSRRYCGRGGWSRWRGQLHTFRHNMASSGNIPHKIYLEICLRFPSLTSCLPHARARP
jgi:integrase